ncbi:MAG: DUF2191 domain-containing protein [Actinobacteria bacterium]|nr:DUF2191 domain-containing protein [Actinomycetota bacterium]
MKVTTIIPDELISSLKKYAKGATLTESLSIALKEWINLKVIKELNDIVRDKPLEFNYSFSAKKIREINRK